MSKKVLAISSSLRVGGNSDLLVDQFLEGAAEAGHVVNKVSLADKEIGFCKGCMACQDTCRCVIDDDAIEIAEKMYEADVIVFASPVYYYSICGQLKTMLDRANPLYPSEYNFREIYLVSTAAESAESACAGSQKAVQGWVDCFPKAKFAGTVFAGGVDAFGEIEGHKALAQAYEMGNNL